MLYLPHSGSLFGIVVAELRAAALLAQQRGAGDGFGNGQQLSQIHGGVPAVVVLAVARDPGAGGALAQSGDHVQRLLHLAFDAHDADQVLHLLLQLVLDGVRILAGWPRSNGSSAFAAALWTCRSSMAAGALALRELRRIFAGALAEDEQVGERIAAQPIGAMQARGHFAGREQTGQRGHLRIAIHADAAHHVVRGGADFHRLLRDVDVGELLELVVHAGQLALDVLGAISECAP